MQQCFENIPFHNLPSSNAKSSVVAEQLHACRVFFVGEVVDVCFLSVGLWIEGRSGEHLGLRMLRTQHNAFDSHQEGYHGSLADEMPNTTLKCKSVKRGVEITGARRVSDHATKCFFSLPHFTTN